MFENTPEKHEEIRKFAERVLTKDHSLLEVWIDEWHQIGAFHDVHISNKDDEAGVFEVGFTRSSKTKTVLTRPTPYPTIILKSN